LSLTEIARSDQAPTFKPTIQKPSRVFRLQVAIGHFLLFNLMIELATKLSQ
jgi:hypothetical protein